MRMKVVGDYKCHHHLLMVTVAGEKESFVHCKVGEGDAYIAQGFTTFTSAKCEGLVLPYKGRTA